MCVKVQPRLVTTRKVIIMLVLSILLFTVVHSAHSEESVGTCSLQSGELLPDAPCYDNCRDTPDQRHFLTCIENACFCRKAGHPAEGPTPPPQQAAVPLNAGAVENATDNSTTVSSQGNSSTVISPMSPGGTSTVSPSGTEGTSNVTSSVTPSNSTQMEGNTSSVAPVDPTTGAAPVTPK